MAPQELLQEVNEAKSPEILGVYKSDVGDEYLVEQIHENGSDLYLMYHVNPETIECVDDERSIKFSEEDLRAALRVVDIENDETEDVNPVHMDVLLKPQTPEAIKFSLLKKVMKDIEKNYPIDAHGAEIEIHPDKVGYDTDTHEAVMDSDPERLFGYLGYTAVSHEADKVTIFKYPEVEHLEDVTPQAIAA